MEVRSANVSVSSLKLEQLSDEKLLELTVQTAEPCIISRRSLWKFCGEEADPDPALTRRLAIWTELKRRRNFTPVTIPWIEDIQMNIAVPTDLGRCIYVCRSFEPNDFAFQNDYLKPGMVTLDIGANAGAYTLFQSRRVGANGSVICFEPSSREFAQLTNNLSINAASNVRPFNCGLSDNEGEATLTVAEPGHAGHNTLGKFCYEIAEAGTETVSLKRVDSVLTTENITRLDFIKIDAEGAEFAILTGAMEHLERYHPVIQLELSDPALRAQGASANGVLDLLRPLSYRFYDTYNETGRPRPFSGDPAFSNVIAVPQGVDIG